MVAAVVFPLDPCLQVEIELIESEIGDPPEHGHEPTFDDRPEKFLLTVLVRRVAERGLVVDRETAKSLGELAGGHRRAIVGEKLTRKTALQERLREAVDEILGGLCEVELGVTAEPGVIVHGAEEIGLSPGAVRREHGDVL